jgi:protein TonB
MKNQAYIATMLILNLISIQILNAQVESYPVNYIVEEMPLFENSDPAVSFSRYIQKQADNSSIIPDSISGKILVHFWIDTTGNVVDPKILRTINESIDSIACQLVLASPKWTPGKQRGKVVKVSFTFPIYINTTDSNHNLNSKEKKTKKYNYP